MPHNGEEHSEKWQTNSVKPKDDHAISFVKQGELS